MPRFVFRPLAPAVVVLLVLIFLGLGSKAAAQDSRDQGYLARWSRFDSATALQPAECRNLGANYPTIAFKPSAGNRRLYKR